MGKTSSRDGDGLGDGGGGSQRLGPQPRQTRRWWIAAGLTLAVAAVAVPAWRVAAVLTGQADIPGLLGASALRLIEPGLAAPPGVGAEGIVLDLGEVALEPQGGSGARLTASAGRLTLPWARVALGLDRPVGLILRQARIDGDDLSVLSDLLARSGPALARVEVIDATWPALDLQAIDATLEPSGALRAEGDRVEPDGSRSRWTLALGAAGADGARPLALDGAGGVLERLTLTGVLAGGGAAASGRIEVRAGAWRLQGGTWTWSAVSGMTADGTLAGPAGAGAVQLSLPSPGAEGSRGALLDLAFGRLDLASLGLAPDRFPGGAALLPDFTTLALALRADLLAFGSEPVGRDLTLAGAVMQGRLLVDEVALALPLGGRVAYRRAPAAGADTLDGRLDLESPAAARELGPYWPGWLPAPPDGAARIVADRLSLGSDGIAVAGLSWSLAGLPEGRIDVAEYQPGTMLRLQAALPTIMVAPERISAALQALSGAPPDLPARLAVDLSIGVARAGEVEASGLSLSASRDAATGPLSLAARAEDLSGATIDLALAADPATLGLSGNASVSVSDPSRWAVLARLAEQPQLERLRTAFLRLLPEGEGTRLDGRASLSEPALDLTLDALATADWASLSGDATVSAPDDSALAARFVRSADALEVAELRGMWRGVGLNGQAVLVCADSAGGPAADFSLRLGGNAPAGAMALPFLLGDGAALGRLTPVLPCRPARLQGALATERVAFGPLGEGEAVDLAWTAGQGQVEITRGRMDLLGGAVEFAGTLPVRAGAPAGQAWATVTDLAMDRLLPDAWRRDVAVGGLVAGDVVFDFPAVASSNSAVSAPEALAATMRGEARLTWSGARIVPRLDPDGLGRLANARALAEYLRTLFQDGPSVGLDLAVRDSEVVAEGVRWNAQSDGGPVAVSGALSLSAQPRVDLTLQLDRPGFPRPYLRLEASGSADAPRLRVDGSWLQPR